MKRNTSSHVHIPIMRIFVTHDFRYHQGILKGENRCRLYNSGFQGPCLYLFLFFFLDRTCGEVSSVSQGLSHPALADILGCGLSPIFVDAILQLNDRDGSDFNRYRVV